VSSVVYCTLKRQFSHVLVVPGLRNHYIASDGELTTNIAGSIGRRGIQNVSVNQYYVDDQLLRQRSVDIVQSLDSSAAINSDFTPVAYFRQIQYWLSYFGIHPWIPAAVMIVLFIAVVGSLNPVSLGMFAGGFAASSVEVILLISFQIIYGYVYQATGFIITLFMAGLAAGAYVARKVQRTVTLHGYAGVQIALVVYSLVLPLILWVLKDSRTSDPVVYCAFLVLTCVVAGLVGVEFTFASRLLRTGIASAASSLYGIDLIGSAFGALIISIYVLPLLGVAYSSFVVAVLCLTSALVSLIGARRSIDVSEGGVFHVSQH